MKQLIHQLRQRVHISMAWSDTSAVRTWRVPMWSVITTKAVVVSILAVGALALLGRGEAVTNIVATVADPQAAKRVSQLEDEKSYLKKQLQVISQEMGVLQARLDRLDVIGEKLFADELFANLSGSDDENAAPEDSLGPGGQGGPAEVDFEKPVDIQKLLEQLAAVQAKADSTEAAMTAGLALVSRDTLNDAKLPQLFPVVHPRAWVSSPYGWRKDPFNKNRAWHSGIDVAAAMNAPIVAAADGYVAFAGYRYAYGIMVELRHANGLSTRYAHLKRSTVSPGDIVKAGDLVGLMGSTGRSTGPHLHFEVLVGDRKVNPYPFVKDTRQLQRARARQGATEKLLSQLNSTNAQDN